MDTGRSLEQLDGEPWGEAPLGATGLVEDVHRLRRVPVGDLSNGDLRQLLGQRIGVHWLIPIALDRLDGDPMAGDWHPGDLLRAVLHAGTDYWPNHPDDVLRLWAVREALDRLRADAAELLDQSDWPAFG